AIEAEHRVRILYACESGSRAWGFASADSDYDVRFVYAHERDWYLSIADGRDVIEQMLPGDLDVSGWDLRKALTLFHKSNPPLLEWLSSPIVYRQDEGFVSEIRALVPTYYSRGSCFRHYLHMAEGNARGYLEGETVRTKKYLYVLRPILGCRWIEQDRGPVPMEFERLLETLLCEGSDEGDVLGAIRELVSLKRSGAELEGAPCNPVLTSFIDRELPRLRALPFRRETPAQPDRLDRLFRAMVADV
ncbi:MAG TPA: nucleotidyltransferase domain-containing protein, partial [Fimbriimonadaceae bacterium]|nr:nucleotidyltransferase domain-containing protein [Fimbriimonadaceae bacterium]